LFIVPRSWCIALLCLSAQLFVACAADDPAITPVDDDDAASDDDDAIDDDDAVQPYSGPAYRPCVTEAQCDPGSACATVPGYGGSYCAPACDPRGDGDECALEGLEFGTSCLDTGRCARHCGDDEEPVPPEADIPPPGEAPACPADMTCRAVGESDLCAGIVAGIAGYYGLCSHPNVDGPDCPAASSCFGGNLIGSDSGVCLPWCDSGSCPDAAGTSNTTPYCYDVTAKVDLDHPVCALLCYPGDETSICPTDQICFDIGFGGIGLCSPPDAVAPPFL